MQKSTHRTPYTTLFVSVNLNSKSLFNTRENWYEKRLLSGLLVASQHPEEQCNNKFEGKKKYANEREKNGKTEHENSVNNHLMRKIKSGNHINKRLSIRKKNIIIVTNIAQTAHEVHVLYIFQYRVNKSLSSLRLWNIHVNIGNTCRPSYNEKVLENNVRCQQQQQQ